MYPRIGNAAGSSKDQPVFSFLTGNRAVAFFFTFAFVFGSATGRCCVQTCVVALSVSVFSFGVYTPLEVISDISLTIMLYCYTPYSVLCSVLLCVRRILYSILSTELSMDLVKWPTYWKQTTLPITQV